VPGNNGSVTREEAIAHLCENQSELQAAGIVRMSLFGSTARGENREDSDIDLLAAFDRNRRISLLDVVKLELRLAELLGTPVDLVEEGTLKPRVRSRVEAEALRAF
jgi:uncharacterized protein